jgi:hypothetical protein
MTCDLISGGRCAARSASNTEPAGLGLSDRSTIQLTLRAESAMCLDPPPGGPTEPITLRDKLANVWKQLLAAHVTN